jgi:hypothetical protein
VKLHHSRVGFPDRLLIRPAHRGPVVFMEFKRTGEKPTKIQQYWLDKLREMGAQAVVITSAAQFYSWLS